MLHVRTALRARSLFTAPGNTSIRPNRILPTQWIRLKSDHTSSGRSNPNTNPIIRPPLSPRELEYDPKRSLRTSSKLNKENVDDRREKFESEVSPKRNTTVGEQLGPDQLQGQKKETDFSSVQDEFGGPHSPQANIAPDGEPLESSQVQFPDLRQGIPSTFETEYLKQSSAPSEAQERAHHELDITESHTR